jgi:ABC-type antimicrobial peptide transport system permease subunit
MNVDSQTVTVAVAGLVVSAILGALAGTTAGIREGILTALVSIVASAAVSIVLESRTRHVAEAKRKQELLEMFTPPQPRNDSEDE